MNRQSPTSLLLATDRLASPLLEAGAAVPSVRTAYTPYGYRPGGPKGMKSCMGFTGQLREPEIGLYMLGNGHRAYNPILMRFHSPDRLSPFGRGGLNSYAYCAGDPINFHDPSGQFLEFAGPLRSILTGFLNLLISALKFGNDRRNRRTYSSNDPEFAASRRGDLATGTIESELPLMDLPSTLLTGVGAGTATGSIVTGGMRLAGMESNGLMLADFTLGVAATGSSFIEVGTMVFSPPDNRYPVDNRPADARQAPIRYQSNGSIGVDEWRFEEGGHASAPVQRRGHGGEVAIEMAEVRADVVTHL